MNNQIPRVIDPADVRVGDLIEVTSTEHPDSKIIDRVKERLGTAIRCQWSYWTGEPDGKTTFRLLDRPEPPKPVLPTTPGTVITCTFDGKSSTLVRDDDGDWFGTHGNGLDLVRNTSATFKITDWTVVYDPTAPEPITVLEVTEDDFAAITCDKPCPGRGYYCTRPEGHDGLHIAAITGHGVYAYWGEVQP